MAEFIAGGGMAILKAGIGILDDLAAKEGARLSEWREHIRWINYEIRYLESYLEDADTREGADRSSLDLLMLEIRDLVYDVEDIIATYFPKLSQHESEKKGFFGCIWSFICILCYGCDARNFAKEIEAIRTRVEDISRRRQTYGINEYINGRPGRDTRRYDRISHPHDVPTTVVGFDDHIKTLKDTLLQWPVISIVGMPGMGKTTLAKKFYNLTKPDFECSVWVCVSQDPDVEELLHNIAIQVGLGEMRGNLENNLSSYLSQKKYVIVLDDIWENETWNALTNIIPCNSEKGSRIIITSRKKNIVGSTIPSFLYELQPLDEGNSRKLFHNMLEHDGFNEELEPTASRIVERCGGMPLQIVVIARLLALKGGRERDWRRVLEGMGQGLDECSKSLALSYKDLPHHLKPCFLYFGLFPKDYKIFFDDLIRLWMAEGFIRASGEEELEDVGEDYMNALISRNLILVDKRTFDGRVESCRIHDLFHNLCILEARKSNFFQVCSDVTHESAKTVRRVTTNTDKISGSKSFKHPTPKLRAMLNFSETDISSVEEYLEDLVFLRVLRMEAVSKGFLQKKIGNLIHLTYLRLGGRIDIELPSTISNLKSLQTLDVRDCFYYILPNVIWKMKQLRHILTGHQIPYAPSRPSRRNCWWISREVVNPIEVSLPNLRTLSMVRGDKLEAEWLPTFTNLRKLGIVLEKGDAVKPIIKVLSDAGPILDKLEDLRLRWMDNETGEIVKQELNLSKYENLHKLGIDGPIMEMAELCKLPPNLHELTLKRTELSRDPMEVLKKLPKLKFLSFHWDSCSGGLRMVCSGPQLEELHFEMVSPGQLTVEKKEDIPRLKKLMFRNCNKIPALHIPDEIRHITTIIGAETFQQLRVFLYVQRASQKFFDVEDRESHCV